MAKGRPPRRWTTRATLMPPPPGSSRLGPQRSLWPLVTCSVVVLTSRAGLMVRVRMGFAGAARVASMLPSIGAAAAGVPGPLRLVPEGVRVHARHPGQARDAPAALL